MFTYVLCLLIADGVYCMRCSGREWEEEEEEEEEQEPASPGTPACKTKLVPFFGSADADTPVKMHPSLIENFFDKLKYEKSKGVRPHLEVYLIIKKVGDDPSRRRRRSRSQRGRGGGQANYNGVVVFTH